MSKLLLLLLLLYTLPPKAVARPKKKRRRNLDRKCITDLRRTGTRFKLGPFLKGMRTPVTILDGRIGKIQYMNGSKRARPRMDCRAALALYRVYPILRANGGVRKILAGRFYSYRYVKNSARLSRHALGLGIDLYGVVLDDGKVYTVTSDYKRGLGFGKTCEGKATTRGGRILRQIACDLERSHYFKAILTPDTDHDHRDHFHLSVYKRGERRHRKNRTALVESQYFGKRWVKLGAKTAYPSVKRIWRVVRARRRANRRLLRSRRKRRRKGKHRTKKSR